MNNRIGMIEFAGKDSDQKVILLTAICHHCTRVAVRAIPCPADLAESSPGTFVGVNEFGRLEAEA